MPRDNINQVKLSGRVDETRKRWTPDGSLAVTADLYLSRPGLGLVNESVEREQPLPLRALAKPAELLLRYQGRNVEIKGCLRRRYYHRYNTTNWGQVEVWVEDCRPSHIQEENL